MESRQTDHIVDPASHHPGNPASADTSAPASLDRSLPTPKLNRAEKQRLIYPYYAGYSEAFVESMLDRLLVTKASRVLDPWNGSGTTTCLAAMRGAHSTGCDLNPVLTLVARARTATEADVSKAVLAWSQVTRLGDRNDASVLSHCESIYRGIVSTSRTLGNELSLAARALILCALFDALRYYYSHAKTRNPAWFSSRAIEPAHRSFGDVIARTSEAFAALIRRHSLKRHAASRRPILHTCDFLDFNAPNGRFDVVLTSPPYLTRLDYVKATLPELMLLGRLRGTSTQYLRSKMMGSPLVGSQAPLPSEPWGKTAHGLLHEIGTHRSKASATYYLKFYLKYFSALERSLTKLERLVRSGGSMCFVVQTSHYKELFIDLPKVVIEMGEAVGFRGVDQIDFAWNKSMAGINQRAIGASKATVESAVVLRKEG